MATSPTEPSSPGPAGLPDPCYASAAWLVGADGVMPGVLTLHDGRLAFVGDDAVVFDEPAPASVTFPRYHRRGCLDVVADGRRRRIRLTRPRHAESPDRHAAYLAGLDLPAGPVGDPADGRRAGRVWRTLLSSSR